LSLEEERGEREEEKERERRKRRERGGKGERSRDGGNYPFPDTKTYYSRPFYLVLVSYTFGPTTLIILLSVLRQLHL
jgi:hypothetical protein